MAEYEIELFPSEKTLKFSNHELVFGTVPRNVKNILEKIIESLRLKDIIPEKMKLDHRKDKMFLHTERDSNFHSGSWDLNSELFLEDWRPYYREGYKNLLNPDEVKARETYQAKDVYYGDVHLKPIMDFRHFSNFGYDQGKDEFHIQTSKNHYLFIEALDDFAPKEYKGDVENDIKIYN